MEKSAFWAPVPKQKVSVVEREGPGWTVSLDGLGTQVFERDEVHWEVDFAPEWQAAAGISPKQWEAVRVDLGASGRHLLSFSVHAFTGRKATWVRPSEQLLGVFGMTLEVYGAVAGLDPEISRQLSPSRGPPPPRLKLSHTRSWTPSRYGPLEAAWRDCGTRSISENTSRSTISPLAAPDIAVRRLHSIAHQIVLLEICSDSPFPTICISAL
jgi:hypothetical protein